VGSDDGIRIWLNGEVVHSHEVGRGHSHEQDQVKVYLKPGTNRFLVKLDNYLAGWGFSMKIPRANF
jgi:hypothetical protein